MHSESDPFGMAAEEAERKVFGEKTIPDDERRICDRTPSHIDIILRIEALQERANIAQQDTEQFRREIKNDIFNMKSTIDASIELMSINTRFVRSNEIAMRANNEHMIKLIESVHVLAMRTK